MLPGISTANAYHVLELVEYVSNTVDDRVRRASITSVSAYRITSPEDALYTKSSGLASHQFLVVEVIFGDKPCFAAIHFQGQEPFKSYPIAEIVWLSDDLESMTRAFDRVIARRYPKHWLSGEIEPPCLGEYAQGKRDEIGTTAEIAVPGEGNAGLKGLVAGGLIALKSTQSFFDTWLKDCSSRIRLPAEEVAEILKSWA